MVEKKRSSMFDRAVEWMSEHAYIVAGFIICSVVYLLSHQKGSCMDRITGALLCSLFSTGVYYGIISLFPSIPPEAAVAVGSLVGFLGVDECKDLLMKKLKKLLDIEDKE